MKTILEKTLILKTEVEKLYAVLSSIESYKTLFAAHTDQWTFDGDVAKLVYDGSTNSSLKIYERKPNEKVVIGTFGDNTLDFDIVMLMMDVGQGRTSFKVSVLTDTNPIFASMMESSVNELMEGFVEQLEKEISGK